jgi:hypothetical protein
MFTYVYYHEFPLQALMSGVIVDIRVVASRCDHDDPSPTFCSHATMDWMRKSLDHFNATCIQRVTYTTPE